MWDRKKCPCCKRGEFMYVVFQRGTVICAVEGFIYSPLRDGCVTTT